MTTPPAPPPVKIAAITMVYQDYWALDQWYRHYAHQIGAQNLFVIAHGDDPEIAEICPLASIITVPREDFTGFDRNRGHMLNAFQNGLQQVYDWVIRTDADELICLDPALYDDFYDFFRQHPTETAVFALGLNLFQDRLDVDFDVESQLALSLRHAACLTGHYSKAWAVRDQLAMVRHGVQLPAEHLDTFPFSLSRGVYLVHLKYANVAALEAANLHRIEIANGTEKGLPGKVWKNADLDAVRFLRKSRALPHVSWETAQKEAYEAIIDCPVRDEGKNVLRARSIAFDFQTSLPEWFKTYSV